VTARNLLVDSDISLGVPGAEIDDGAALIAVQRHRDLEMVAVTTTFGNATVETVTTSARRLLHALDADLTPCSGADRPVTPGRAFSPPWEPEHTLTGGDPSTTGAEHIIAAASQRPGLEVLAIGPLTNVAIALTLEPALRHNIRRIYAMGGDTSPDSEFNFTADPAAVVTVLSSGIPVTLFGLDITKQATFTRDWFCRLPKNDPALAMLADAAPNWIDMVERHGWSNGSCALHDAVAAVYLTCPAIATVRPATANELAHRGLPENANLELAVELDDELFARELLAQLTGHGD
jgi:inosine-uridine nucleoside N-ribohydrolase